jgi:hypothetical protein
MKMAEDYLDSQSPEDKIAETLRTAKFEAERFLRCVSLSTESERRCYVYLILLPDGTPRYVGKGSGRRIRKHSAAGGKHTNFILAADYEKHGNLPIFKIIESLTNDEALSLEKHLIEHYGITDEGGTLANLNLGGYCVAPLVGASKRRHSEALKAKLSEPEVYAKRIEQLDAMRADKEIEARRRNNHARAMRDPALREKRRIISAELAKRPDVMAKRSVGISRGKKAYFEQHAERIEIRGEFINRHQIADKYGLSYHLVKNRYRAGKRGEDLIAPVDIRFSHKPI